MPPDFFAVYHWNDFFCPFGHSCVVFTDRESWRVSSCLYCGELGSMSDAGVPRVSKRWPGERDQEWERQKVLHDQHGYLARSCTLGLPVKMMNVSCGTKGTLASWSFSRILWSLSAASMLAKKTKNYRASNVKVFVCLICCFSRGVPLSAFVPRNTNLSGWTLCSSTSMFRKNLRRR